MLPPDTPASLMPWRVLVRVMQVWGCFPYRISPTRAPPVFSLPLFLWGVFIQLLTIGISCVSFQKFIDLYQTSDVGSFVFLYSSAVMLAVICFIPILLTIKSDKLAALLHDMSLMKEVFPRPKNRCGFHNKTLSMLASFVIFGIGMTWYSYNFMDCNYHEALVLMTWSASCNAILYSHESLVTILMDLLGRRLVVVAEATVTAFSTLLAPDGSFYCSSDEAAALLALHRLDSVIREVWNVFSTRLVG